MKRILITLTIAISLIGGLIISPSISAQADEQPIKPTPSGDAPIGGIVEEGSAVSPAGMEIGEAKADPIQGIGQIYLLQETFEGSFPTDNGWTVYDCDASDGLEYYWNDVAVNPWAGSWAGWVAAGGANGFIPASTSTTYPNNTCAWMKIGPYNLAGVNSGSFTLKYWNKSEASWDYLKWFVSINNSNWYGYVHSGNSGGYQTGTIDLSNVPTLGDIRGDTSVWFSVIFDADASNVDSGAYVDNIYLEVTKTCYLLDLDWYSDGGSGTVPTASPASSGTCSPGYYYAGEAITLTAHPDASSTVTRWYGTDNNSSTNTTNTVTMPASTHYAGAYYGAAETSDYFQSVGSQDGWILESTETSNKGGTMSTSGMIYIGDDKLDRQYKGILSFDTTSLPDGAVINDAWIAIHKSGVIGSNPYKTHGALYCDLRKGYFGSSQSLQLTDFAASASLMAAGRFYYDSGSGLYWAQLSSGALAYINKTGYTQCRVRFAKDDNDDKGADVFKIDSGSASNTDYRPTLWIYYTP
jgi:hypothetical protein